jgi:RHS repeat-associated protein
MTYDGLGNRLEMTTYVDGTSSTTRYQLDNGQNLAAIGAESSTFYLNGMGVIGTLGESWSYILQDGAGSTRQLATPDGAVTLSVSYTPWGDTLEVYGSGMLNLGYMGGVYDAGTGLIYMGNGQYYDPSTGRFLTRGANADQSNPYTPWNNDPAGMLIAPLALLALVFGRKKNRTKLDHFIILVVIAVSLGMSVLTINPVSTVFASESHSTSSIRIPPPPEQPNIPNTTDASETEGSNTIEEGIPATSEVAVLTAEQNNASICGIESLDLPTHSPDPKDGDGKFGTEWGWRSKKLYNIYLQMYKEEYRDKWWWKVYGSDGHFSLNEFFATVWIREINDSPSKYESALYFQDYVEAMSRHVYHWCTVDSGYDCKNTQNQGIAYFLVDWSSQVWRMTDACTGDCSNLPLDSYFENNFLPITNNWARLVVKKIKEPEPEWTVLHKYAPYDAANAQEECVDPELFRQMHDMGHKAYFESPLETNNANPDIGRYVITTFCEMLYLTDDPKSQDLYKSWNCQLPPPDNEKYVRRNWW